MASDKIGLANVALRKIGAARISNLTDDTPEARAVNDVYPDILKEVLSEEIWTFAQHRATLAQLSITIPSDYDGVTIAYALPNDFVKLNFYSDRSALVSLENISGQNVLLSDTNGLAIRYTFYNDDPATYGSNFTAALIARLASEICFNLTQATKESKILYENYLKVLLPKARSTDAQQGTPNEAVQDEWEIARNIAGSGIIGRPGQQTWHPYGG